jgi:hypothetical protein
MRLEWSFRGDALKYLGARTHHLPADATATHRALVLFLCMLPATVKTRRVGRITKNAPRIFQMRR